jgi:hypothetical protein
MLCGRCRDEMMPIGARLFIHGASLASRAHGEHFITVARLALPASLEASFIVHYGRACEQWPSAVNAKAITLSDMEASIRKGWQQEVQITDVCCSVHLTIPGRAVCIGWPG